MWRRIVGYFSESPDETINFEWCCRPLLVAMNLFGIPLGMHEADESIRVWISNVFGWILYFMNVATGLIMICIESEFENVASVNGKSIEDNRTTAWQWNSGISTYNAVCSTIAIQTVLLAITAVRWKDLARVLHRMERINQFSPKEFSHFRTIFRLGLLVAIFMCVAVFFLSMSAYFDTGFLLWQMIFYSFQRSFIVFICLAVVLFICFGWMASTMMQLLGKEMTHFVSDPDGNDTTQFVALISRWSRHYFTIIEFVHQMNRCFGCLLLVMVAPAFVRVINTSFHLMIDMKDGQWTVDVTVQLIVLFFNFVGFTFMTNIPHSIRQEAVDLTKKLRKLHFEDYALQNQVNVLMMEISNSLPKITAAGFFDVDLQLIPTLIGTTLTYLIILFQFQTSEKR
ncbi:gustatory and pheromone receptor 39a-like [Daphnia carinata]|uniref:gustatory and pheromone receptor 39a-like n=1 Tax=Daphnia carinata TaxID=120202 RepID=UPI00257E3BA5|nr:gustatory and pheromone receptor 39a-like [Daphnia carinata]